MAFENSIFCTLEGTELLFVRTSCYYNTNKLLSTMLG